MVELLRGAVGDARDLAIAHLDGMRLEAREELGHLKKAAKLSAVAIASCSVAALVLAGAATQALQLVMPSWAAHLIVAIVLGGAGAIAFTVMKREKDIDLVPEKELAKTARDAKWVARRTREAVT
jgi:hypothetical protein